jgi:anti-sigma B factor antagonist
MAEWLNSCFRVTVDVFFEASPALSASSSQRASARRREPYESRKVYMALKATVTSNGDVQVITLDGKITLGDGSGTLRETVRAVLDSGAKKVLLDLGRVGYLDSSGLGELVGCYTTAKNNGATLKLLNLQTRVQGLMQITKLYLVFEVFEDEAEAIRSFTTASVAPA